MGSIVGFTVFLELSPEAATRATEAEDRALARFVHLERRTILIGAATLHVWGHSQLFDRIHSMPDGSTLVLIGSPHNEIAWHAVQETLLKSEHPDDFTLPWEGRVILLQVGSDGRRWRIWNDWLGSITIYHADIQNGRIASTLEPVTVSTTAATPDDFFLPGLVSLLLNGYFLTDWTLYKRIKTIPPDSLTTWDEKGFRSKSLWTVLPSQERWETSWDDLVDEMHAISYQAIADTLKTQPSWILPLSSGLDSRLIAGVVSDVGANVYTYAWGDAGNTDVIYSAEIAKTLGLPWKHIVLPKNFLIRYTQQWFDWFGCAMHFQGMYLMSFLDELNGELDAPILNGFVGDVLAGDDLKEAAKLHATKQYQVDNEWYSDWSPEQLQASAKFPVEEALEANAENIKGQIASFPGAWHQKLLLLPLWNRQRSFISFLSTLMGYWRDVATPYLNRSYVRFCLSLPRVALDDRRLLGDVFKRYYGKLAVIPGSYASEPYISTGRYLLKRRIFGKLPASIRHHLIKGMENRHIGVDFEPIQTHGKDSLWPLFNVWDQVAEWLDLKQVERDYRAVMTSNRDVQALRRLQIVQTFSSRFLNSTIDRI